MKSGSAKASGKKRNPRGDVTETARQLLSGGGIGALSMRAIAKQLGVSPMMPYKHFASKDHLLMELRLNAFRSLTERMRHVQASASDAGSAVIDVCREYVAFAVDKPNEYRLMFDAWEFENYDQIIADLLTVGF